MSMPVVGTVKIRCSCSALLRQNLSRISVLFSAKLKETTNSDGEFTVFNVEAVVPGDRPLSDDFLTRLQKYVDDICGEGCKGAIVAGEDSSYDSDYDNDTTTTTTTTKHHQDVSRTTSDTLAAEYAEYVQTTPETYPGYTARVEFALKLGYTEKLVQAALTKLGPSPAQNELLAELIKLGAQQKTNSSVGGTSSSCDNSPSDNNLDITINDDNNTTNPTTSYMLRPIVIDGSNVAMSHGNKEIFSCRGIKLCVDWFKLRGHKDITVFVPKWRKESPRLDNPIKDQDILAELEKDRLLVFTPSRLIGGKRMVCYDDRYILRLASEIDGIVVSNDNYRDLCQENSEFRRVIEERILMYSFVNDRFMPPDDPLGRSGPTLDNFLRYQTKKVDVQTPPPCPYGKKCTYGNKCKYHHPERGPFPHKSVTERLSEHAQRHLQARELGDRKHQPLNRTRSNIPTTTTTKDQHVIVSKSRSVDNVVGTQSYQQQENLHRKLQRQLTLNPINDSRLLVNRPQFLTPSNWDLHQHVTRIASAPDSYRSSWQMQQQQQATTSTRPHMMRISSCSDTQLNLWQNFPTFQQQYHQTSTDDIRRKLHYHLAAIFPEEQVTQAMQMLPDETNPQKICATILSMFPKT